MRFQSISSRMKRLVPIGAVFAVVVGMIAAPALAQEKQEKLNKTEQGSAAPAAAADATDPVVIVTLGSINQLTQDLNYLSGAIGQPQLGGMFAMMAGTFTQGIDTTEPVGIFVPIVDGAPEPIAMIPTRDVKLVLKRLEGQTGPADELDDGTLVIAIGANTVFIRQIGNWAVLGRTRAVLDAAPIDPAAVVKEMGADYDLAIKLDVQQVPPAIRDSLIEQLRRGFDQAMAQNPGNEDTEAAKKYAEQSLEQLEQIVSQTDDLMIGLNVDSNNREIALDVSFTAVAGSQLATMYQSQQPIPSAYSMVIRPDAAGYIHASSSIGPEVIEQTRSSIQGAISMARQMLSGVEELTAAEQTEAGIMIDRIAELIVDSYEEGKLDMGALLLTDANQVQFVFGSFIADGNEAAKIVKEIAAKVEGRGDAPRFEFDRDTYKGVAMHLIEADVPGDEDEVRKIFGEKIRLHIGTADNAIYVALGDASQELLTQMIDQATTPVAAAADAPLAQMRVNLMPLMQFAQSIENNDSIAAMLDALARANDPGRLEITSRSIANGSFSRIVVGDGLLQAIGAAYRQAEMDKLNQNQF